jgi:glutamate dehydrogenase
VEFLPTDADIATLAHDGKGLTRPELAVLIAYAKLDLDAEILASGLPDDPALFPSLAAYFPQEMARTFPAELPRHRLKREIISTGLANRIVNLAGPLFVVRMKELSGATGAEVARAFLLADGAFGLESLKKRIDALDGRLDAGLQLQMYAGLAEHLRRVTPWFLSNVPANAELGAAMVQYRAGVEALRPVIEPYAEDKARIDAFTGSLPADLMRDWALLRRLSLAPDIAHLAKASGYALPTIAKLYFGAGDLLGLDRLRQLAGRIASPEHWDRMAIRRLMDDLFAAQRTLAQNLLPALPKEARPPDAAKALLDWSRKNEDVLERTRGFLSQLESAGDLSIAKLTLANSQIHKLASL